MVSNGKKIVSLMEEFRGLPEYALYKSLTGFNISLYIFNTNYSHLKNILEFVMNDPKFEALMDVRNRDQLNSLLDDIIRLLHNFVAAAISLVDHTRNIYKELYIQTGKFSDYQDRIDREFKDDPLVQFVHCLRQYCQHYRAPNISIQHSWDKNDKNIKNTVNLLKSDLEMFSSWNTNARKYSDLIKERVDVYELITAYREKVLNFHIWFNSRQNEIHKAEFDLLKKKEEELLIAQLNHFLEMGLSSKEKSRVGEVDIFYGIFNSKDYKELSEIPMDSPKRCARAIELLQGYISIPGDVRKKINDWYEKQI